MTSVRLSRVSRPERDGFGGSISQIVEAAYEKKIRDVRCRGISLSLTFMFLWVATMFVAKTYPAFFGIVAACR